MPSYLSYKRSLDFDESKHPRSKDNGRFVAKNGTEYKMEEGNTWNQNYINAVFANKTVGSIGFKLKNGFAMVGVLEVDKEHQGNGVGRELIRRAENHGKLKFKTTNNDFWSHIGYSKKQDGWWTKND